MELSYEDVRKKILPDSVKMEENTSPDITDGMIIGQDRAVSALDFGLHMEAVGFNIYVSGLPGIGKMTSVRSFLTGLAREKEAPPDLCCLYNFYDPYEPRMIRLPAGRGKGLASDMDLLIRRIREDLPRAFESEEYGTRREAEMKDLLRGREGFSAELNEKARQMGFSLQVTPMGLLIIPVKDGQPISDESFAGLPEDLRKDLETKREELQKDIKNGQAALRRLEADTRERVRELDGRIILNAIGGFLDELTQQYAEHPEVGVHISGIREDILKNTDLFNGGTGERQVQPVPGMEQQPDQTDQALSRYRVNVMVDNSGHEGAPVVVELNPTYTNLVGRLEKEMKYGALLTDFSLIRAGALARADGGYLVLQAEDLFRNPLSWEALKRCLRNGELRIEEPGEQMGFLTLKSLRPQPIALSVKVILVGPPELYRLLFEIDQEFQELFKVKADFDTRMSRTDENLKNFIHFVFSLSMRENLRKPDRSALEALLRLSARNAEHRDRISLNFGSISDLLREANYWAARAESNVMTGKFIEQAAAQKIYRSNLIQTRLNELVAEGSIVIDTRERKIGQVNGLSVMDSGDFSFGRPVRITAVAGPGREGITDIERETRLGGPIHSKGVLILSGCLARKYYMGKPVSLSAQIVFEQSYSPIEGDSASQAEFYALVSALSGVPLRQDIAVTGSIDQFGDAQAIGGVNEKIEGFYEVCAIGGFTGNQGVIIPESNRQNLMLREDVADAIRRNRFHLWTVKNTDDGIALLTGEEPGSRREDGTYPIGTVNRKAADTIKTWSDMLGEDGRNGKKREG